MRLGAALLWTVVLGFLLSGTFATLPWLFRDGGWLPIAACAAWSACIPGALYLVIRFAPRRLTNSKSAPVGMLLIVLVVLIGMMVAPAAAIAFLYGPEAATGGSYISAFIGLCGIVASGVIYNWRSEREAAERDRFLAQFMHGPIGQWRGVRLGLQRVEEGCQIVFNHDGTGHYRLWEAPENEAAAPTKPFHWRETGENRIEVQLDGNGPLKEIEFILPYYGANIVKMMLRPPRVELPEIVLYDVGFAEYDRIHWPRYLIFDYLAEPSATIGN